MMRDTYVEPRGPRQATNRVVYLRPPSMVASSGTVASRIGRCKGRGVRVCGLNAVVGRAHIVPEPGHVLWSALRINAGEIVIAMTFRAEWAASLMAAGGLVIGCIDPQAAAMAFALQHRIPLIFNIPNAGQFVQGELICLNGDGRVTVAL